SEPRTALRWLNEAWRDPEAALQKYAETAWPNTAHRRLVLALAQDRAGVALGSRDVVSLLRTVLRAESRQVWEYGQNLLVPRPTSSLLVPDCLGSASISLKAESLSGAVVSARRWRPNWLTGTVDSSPEDSLYDDELRRRDDSVLPDPVLWRAQLETYKSEAQREAVRTVLSAPPGSTVVVN